MQPPEHEGNDEQQQQDDGHQAADEDGRWAPLSLGHGLLASGLQLWRRRESQNHRRRPTRAEGPQGGMAAQDPLVQEGAPAAHPSC